MAAQRNALITKGLYPQPGGSMCRLATWTPCSGPTRQLLQTPPGSKNSRSMEPISPGLGPVPRGGRANSSVRASSMLPGLRGQGPMKRPKASPMDSTAAPTRQQPKPSRSQGHATHARPTLRCPPLPSSGSDLAGNGHPSRPPVSRPAPSEIDEEGGWRRWPAPQCHADSMRRIASFTP